MKLYRVDYLSLQGGFNKNKYIVASDFDSAYQAFKKLNLGVIMSMSASIDHEDGLLVVN